MFGNGRAEPRLDPVRWRRPGRITLVRLVAVAVLLGMAAAVAWSRPSGCASPASAPAPQGSAGAAAAGSTVDGTTTTGGTAGRSATGGTADADVGRADGDGGRADADVGRADADVGRADADVGRADADVGRADSDSSEANGPAGPGTDSSDARAVVPAGLVGVPVRIGEPVALALVRAGDRVDLLSIDGVSGHSTVIAAGALVLSVSDATDPTSGGLLVALRPAEARRAVGAPERARFAVLIRP